MIGTAHLIQSGTPVQWLWGTLSSRGYSGWGMKLTTHFH